MAEIAPDYFIEAFRRVEALVTPAERGTPVATAAQANAFWRALKEIGWESQRLTGGERLPPCLGDTDGDGNCPAHPRGCPRLSPPKKIPTLVLPR